MPDALLISRNPHDSFPMERAVSSAGYRVKATHDLRIALSWLGLRAFQVIVIDAAWGLETIRRVLQESGDTSASSAVYIVGQPEELKPAERARYLQELALRGVESVELDCLAPRLAAVRQSESTEDDKSFRILVVEDLDSPRDIICHYMEKVGNAVVTGVRSVGEALTLLEANPQEFDCIVTDLSMPEVSGNVLVEQLRRHPDLQRLPVIVLTAYGTAENLVKCLKAGASGFLVKPPKRAELLRELGRARRIAQGAVAPRIATIAEADAIEQILIELGFAG